MTAAIDKAVERSRAEDVERHNRDMGDMPHVFDRLDQASILQLEADIGDYLIPANSPKTFTLIASLKCFAYAEKKGNRDLALIHAKDLADQILERADEVSASLWIEERL